MSNLEISNPGSRWKVLTKATRKTVAVVDATDDVHAVRLALQVCMVTERYKALGDLMFTEGLVAEPMSPAEAARDILDSAREALMRLIREDAEGEITVGCIEDAREALRKIDLAAGECSPEALSLSSL